MFMGGGMGKSNPSEVYFWRATCQHGKIEKKNTGLQPEPNSII
jgi:hypothetical protein